MAGTIAHRCNRYYGVFTHLENCLGTAKINLDTQVARASESERIYKPL